MFKSLPRYNLSNISVTDSISITLFTEPKPKISLKKFKIFLKMLFLFGESFFTFGFIAYVLKSSANISSISKKDFLPPSFLLTSLYKAFFSALLKYN